MLVVGKHHDHLQRRRREMQTDAFKKAMYQRSGIEGTISEFGSQRGHAVIRYISSGVVVGRDADLALCPDQPHGGRRRLLPCSEPTR